MLRFFLMNLQILRVCLYQVLNLSSTHLPTKEKQIKYL